MLNRKPNTVGVDSVIDKFQLEIYADLILRPNWSPYESYYRAELNKRNNETIPEIPTSKINYKEVLFNDRVNVSSFFLVEDERTYDDNLVCEQKIYLIFQGLLNKLYPSLPLRGDEEMLQDIYQSIKNVGWEKRLKKITTDADGVYSGIDISGDKKYLDNMSNYKILKYEFDVKYVASQLGCGNLLIW